MATKTEMTLAEVKRRIAGLRGEQRKSTVCALIGHSRIVTFCFGYANCGRCGAQVGDSLGGVWSGAESSVIIGHNCKVCRKNYKSMTWRDKFLVPNPFAKKKI